MSCENGYIFDSPVYSGNQYIFDSSCYVDLGQEVGGKSKKKRQEEYEQAFELALWRKRQQEAIEAAVELEQAKHEKGRRVLTLKPKKAIQALEVDQSEIDRLAKIQDELDRAIAIEFMLNLLQDFKRKEIEALSILLLMR